ncbi:MAG: peptidoglycan D,D-transpeptidase FtsI family protein [Alphaproteobacteria bacterium]
MFFSRKKEETYPIGQEIPLKRSDNYRFLDSITVHALKTGRTRMMILAYTFLLLFGIVEARLFEQTIIRYTERKHHEIKLTIHEPVKRADITDRNGILLATSLPIVDLYVDARYMPDADEVANALMNIFPDLKKDELLKKLQSKKSFEYVRRNLTPQEEYQVNALGYPQLGFINSERRVYPQSHLYSHLLGFTNIDNQGIAGLEKQYDQKLADTDKSPLVLSVDARIQEIVRDELMSAIEKFSADGAVGIVMDVKNAEILAMVSLPDFDLNKMPIDANKIPMNKATLGMYELGSVMKPFTVAFGLQSGLIKENSKIEAYDPYQLSKGRKITDFHAENRILSVTEVLVYSSNIGTAKIAQMLGPTLHKSYLNNLHFLNPLPLALPEKGKPIVQKKWDMVETATIGYGYGLAVSPLHMVAGFAALINGGFYMTPTFIKDANKDAVLEQVITPEVSKKMRYFLRAVAEIGSGKRANVEGLNVIGKTGTAQMQDPTNGKYIEGKVRNSFISAFPMDKPKYIVYVMIENPAKKKEYSYYNTAGWNACPTGGRIIQQIAPVLGVKPAERAELPPYVNEAYEYLKNKKKR